jgi:L-rhamnose mutarotase
VILPTATYAQFSLRYLLDHRYTDYFTLLQNCRFRNVKIYTGVSRPVLTYTGETRPDTSQTKEMTETAEMGKWRKTVRKTMSDHIRSQDMRRQSNVQEIR